jgi:hypothetical protein
MAMPEDRSGGMRGGGMKNGTKSDREATMNRFEDIVYEKLKTKLS